MTYRARDVLADCRIALTMLEEEPDPQRWRIQWAGAMALTRAVGHVLDKVDGADPVLKQVSNEFFKKWKTEPEHEIFTSFIERERNGVLKEYAGDVHPLDEVPVVLQAVAIPPGGGEPKMIGDVMTLDENLYRPLLDGPWQGIDCREVLGEALDWWEEQLGQIDNEVRVRRHGGNL